MAYQDFLLRPRELHEHLRDDAWRVVDCRFDLANPEKGYSEYVAGHIPGAVYAHLDRDLAAPVTEETGRHPLPDPQAFALTLGRLGINRDTRVVAYDHASGAIASRLWWLLRWIGHPSVRLLDGGLAAWRRAELPLEAAVPDVEPTRYVGKPDPGMVVTTKDVEEALGAGDPLPLVDAREAARFEGRSEPIDPVAGHIPGARNLPFSSTLTPEAEWRSPAELLEAWERALGPPHDVPQGDRSRLAVMCGSGVTACHLALSAGLAGRPLPRLYAGSWSEWVRDPHRPVATGQAGEGKEPGAEGS
ncbi:MAG TPA: sulfurtransferase [Woeseiaceae bacterium]|nr:sulfurtransferase [Woeseiaceae bacterium]